MPDYRGVDFRDIAGGMLDNGLRGSLWKAPSLGWAFSLMAGMSIGIAQGALERFLERSAGRPIRGTTYKDQLDAPLTHLMLAEVHSKIRSATLMARANADETDALGVLAAAGTPADPERMQLFSARVLVETAYAAKWCAEAIELLQRNSGSTAIMDFEPIQRAWRDARVITLHGALNLEALSENYGRLMAGMQPHQFAGITTLDRFAPARRRRRMRGSAHRRAHRWAFAPRDSLSSTAAARSMRPNGRPPRCGQGLGHCASRWGGPSCRGVGPPWKRLLAGCLTTAAAGGGPFSSCPFRPPTTWSPRECSRRTVRLPAGVAVGGGRRGAPRDQPGLAGPLLLIWVDRPLS